MWVLRFNIVSVMSGCKFARHDVFNSRLLTEALSFAREMLLQRKFCVDPECILKLMTCLWALPASHCLSKVQFPSIA